MEDADKEDKGRAAGPERAGEAAPYRDFIREIIDGDLARGKNAGRVATRFPPEPNGYLHIGHAKSICLNFGLAAEFGGTCALRFDDTNPIKEETEYIESIIEDVRWLGFDWKERLFYASDYFERMYGWAEHLIEQGKAYVCDLSPDEIRAYRGTLTQPGRPSPYRDRTALENLELFRRMRAGEFPNGARVLRARIDMASPNFNMRDPVLYRILHAAHPHAGAAWCLYPMYDYAHPLEDAIEGITHSICTLEFEDHRPLYDWFLDQLPVPCHPQQIEFARLNLTYTVLSKRNLRQLVGEGHVTGWDDPRMPTISGLRRRGYTPAAIRAFCERIGVAKRDSRVDVTLLENAVREDLNRRAPRVMAVLRPLRVVLENYPEGKVEEIEAVNNPEDPAMGTRTLRFARELYIDQDDFREDPPKKFFRLSPGQEIRLRYAYIIKCVGVVKDPATGEIVALRCTYDPDSLEGRPAGDGPEAKGGELAGPTSGLSSTKGGGGGGSAGLAIDTGREGIGSRADEGVRRVVEGVVEGMKGLPSRSGEGEGGSLARASAGEPEMGTGSPARASAGGGPEKGTGSSAAATGQGRRVKGTAHWVSAAHAIEAEVRLYEHLFISEVPGGAVGAEATAGGSGAAKAGTAPGAGAAAAAGSAAARMDAAARTERTDAAARTSAAPLGIQATGTGAAARSSANPVASNAAGTQAAAGKGAAGASDEEEDLPGGGPAGGPGRVDWKADLNPASLTVLTGCRLEPSLAAAVPGSRWQFERQGYFCLDAKDSRPGAPVFNRTVTLRDTWAKIEKKLSPSKERGRH